MYNILICDDDADIRAALRLYLAPEGYGIFEAADGAEALALLARETIHLVLMDLMMPQLGRRPPPPAHCGSAAMSPSSCSLPKVRMPTRSLA